MRVLRIVHISDLHLSKSNSYETNNVLQSLILDVKNRLKELESSDTFVAITGDLTYGGTSEEFQMVKDFTRNLGEGALLNE